MKQVMSTHRRRRLVMEQVMSTHRRRRLVMEWPIFKGTVRHARLRVMIITLTKFLFNIFHVQCFRILIGRKTDQDPVSMET